MTKDQFWQTIDELNKTSFHKDQESRQVLMSESLHHHSLEDIMDWHLIMTAYHELANRDDLWAACTRLGAWDTDDGFSDFRSWLISRGKEVYMNALRDPHSLDTVPYEGEKLNFELFAYSAYHAYDAKMFRINPRSMDTLFNALKTHELDPQTLQDIRAEIPRQKHHSRDRLGHMFRVAFSVGSDAPEPQTMKELAETVDVAYGYVYEGGQHTQYVFYNSPENIANFIGSHPHASEITVTDAMDWLMLNTFGTFINQCPDQDLLEKVKETLVPIQMGLAEAQPFLCPTRSEMDEYIAQNDTMQMGF